MTVSVVPVVELTRTRIRNEHELGNLHVAATVHFIFTLRCWLYRTAVDIDKNQ